MGYLLDTNVISETQRARPDIGVMSFLASIRDANVCMSVMTIGELQKGAEAKRKTSTADAERIFYWIGTIETSFGNRILPVDRATARLWGELSAGRSRPVVDMLIAATALTRGMTLVTRNLRDMEDTGAPLINPWFTPSQNKVI